ncbi:hypothetical protein CDO44_11475 [Pigmentiphaga sp. NML080357]|nr:hypothetical protein CDO44_11475 [Pigmentiphaga sp. NML080357]
MPTGEVGGGEARLIRSLGRVIFFLSKYHLPWQRYPKRRLKPASAIAMQGGKRMDIVLRHDTCSLVDRIVLGGLP